MMNILLLQEMSANIALVLHPADVAATWIRARCRMSSRDYLGAMADFDFVKDRGDSKFQQQVCFTVQSNGAQQQTSAHN